MVSLYIVHSVVQLHKKYLQTTFKELLVHGGTWVQNLHNKLKNMARFPLGQNKQSQNHETKKRKELRLVQRMLEVHRRLDFFFQRQGWLVQKSGEEGREIPQTPL